MYIFPHGRDSSIENVLQKFAESCMEMPLLMNFCGASIWQPENSVNIWNLL